MFLFTAGREINFLKDSVNTLMQQLQSVGNKIQNTINKGDELSRSYQALLTEFNAQTRQQHNFNLSVKRELESLRALISTPVAPTTSIESQSNTTTTSEITAVVPELTKTVRKTRSRKVVAEESVVPVKKPRAKKTNA